MQSRFRNVYSGQAIAIVMVILVVASVLGVSLYSRTLKGNQSVVDKQDSDASLEQVDIILDLIASEASFETLSGLVEEADTLPIEYKDLNTFATDANIDPSILTTVPWCEESAEGTSASSLKIALGITDPSEKIDVTEGNDRTFNFEGTSIDTGCQLPVTVNLGGSSQAVFAVKRIYMNSSGEVKDYAEEDMKAYCVSENGTCTDGSVEPIDSLEQIGTGDTINIEIEDVGSYDLAEVKIITLKGIISTSFGEPTCSIEDLNLSYIKINVGVNCSGSYREKQMVFPSMRNLGYSTIFDYTIYNNGVLRPR